jgi:Family of unknown function (DUF5681)
MSKKSSNPGWFPKGRSGNPNGRPKGHRAPNASAIEVLVDKNVTISDGCGTRDIPVEEALQKRTFQDALAGKQMAVRTVIKWIIKRDAWRAKHAPKAARTSQLIISPDPDNADAALVLLGIAAPDPARADFRDERAQLRFEPWAVQAALDRRRGARRLTERALNRVRRSTRDPDTVRWPKGLKDDV